MTIGNWKIGEFSPQHVISSDYSNYPTITLNCLAKPWQGADARWEIEQIWKIACQSDNVYRKKLMNGGECLRTSPGCSTITISDGMYQWKGVVLYPKFDEDQAATPGRDQRIEWDIVLELQDNTKTLLLVDPTK